MRFRVLMYVLPILALVAPIAAADELRLKNGDRYSGTVVRLESGTLTFTTAHGELAIPWTEVTSLAVDEAIVVKTVAGEETSQAGGGIDMATTVALRRPAPPMAVSGGAAAGFMNTGGNSDVNSLRLDGDVVVRLQENRYTFGAAVNRARTSGVETARNWSATARYDRFIASRTFVNANGILTHDPFRDLDLRTALGGGIGYQLVDTAATKLSVEGGAGYVRENFEAADDDSYGALREAVKLEVLPAGPRIVLFHQHDGYFGFSGDNRFVKAQNGIRLAIAAGLVATAQIDVDYDGDPSPGRRSIDRVFSLTFGYRF